MKKTPLQKESAFSGTPASLTVSLFAGLTVCFFSPAEIYLNNPEAFQLSAVHVLLPLLLLGTAVSGILFILLMLLRRFRCFRIICSAIFGLILGGYIQMLFCNGRMRQLDGESTAQTLPTYFINLNWFLILLTAMFPLILNAAAEKKPNAKFSAILRSGKVLPAVSAALLLMQSAGLAGLLPQAKRGETQPDLYFSYEPVFSVSQEQNITVFLTDRLDGAWLDTVLEQYPELNDTLDGFTYYRNNIAEYCFTYPSVPHMLSGIDFAGEDYSDYWNKIWNSDENMLQKLHSSGYRISLLPDLPTTCGTPARLMNIADNIRRTESVPQYNYLGSDGILPTMMQLSMQKMLPYLLKDLFPVTLSTEHFRVYDHSTVNGLITDITPQSDVNFHNALAAQGLKVNSAEKTFSFIHLSSTHFSDPAIAALYPQFQGNTADVISTARGSFETISLYLSELKRLGVYDQTTVIVLGDHGRYPRETAILQQEQLDEPIITALLIKPANAASAPLQTDSVSEMTNRCFPAGILEFAGLPHDGYGLSWQDIEREQPQTERVLNLVADGSRQYTVTGDARDFSNWVYQKP